MTALAGLPAGRILSVGPRPFTCSSRFSSQMRLGRPNRSQIFLKSMMTSTRSATDMRVLVISTGRGSRLPSLAISQNGMDCARIVRVGEEQLIEARRPAVEDAEAVAPFLHLEIRLDPAVDDVLVADRARRSRTDRSRSRPRA